MEMLSHSGMLYKFLRHLSIQSSWQWRLTIIQVNPDSSGTSSYSNYSTKCWNGSESAHCSKAMDLPGLYSALPSYSQEKAFANETLKFFLLSGCICLFWLENFLCNGSDSKYFQICGTGGLCDNHSVVVVTTTIVATIIA
jgi:hypothetical protein